MLNYIWAGLIIFSLVFALANDTRDLTRDTYRNGKPIPVTVYFPSGYDPSQRLQAVEVEMAPATLAEYPGIETTPPMRWIGTLAIGEDGRELRFAADANLPEPLSTIRQMTSSRANDLRGVTNLDPGTGVLQATTTVTLPTVRFVKLNAITQAAFDFAEIAVTLALGLIGALALWLGLLRIAEKAGLIESFVRLVQPILRPFFPQLPKDSPALGYIALNLTANVLGLGNAATPFGLKAMEELQELNPVKDTATNSMVMLLAMNTASVQLVPPVMLVAIMGLQVNELFFGILLVTAISLTIAVFAARGLGRMKRYRDTDPMRQAAAAEPTV
jgi:spore maturation protein A